MPYGVVISCFQGHLNSLVFKGNGRVNAVVQAKHKEAVCGHSHMRLEATSGEETGGVKAGICLAQDGKPIIGKTLFVLLAGKGFDCFRNLFEVLSGHLVGWVVG